MSLVTRILFVTCVAPVLAFGGPSAHDRTADPSLTVAARVVDGSSPGIRVAGLRPNEVVRVHALRSLEKWRNEGDQWKRVRQPLHAYVDLAASAEGSIDVDTAPSIAGSYVGADPLGLLRNGWRVGDVALRGVLAFPPEPLDAGPTDRVHVKLERGGRIVAETTFQLVGVAEGIVFEQVRGDRWHATYARPATGERLRPVVTLHGSEGGSVEKSRGRAAQFANAGFAALAIDYFAYEHERIEGVPTQHAEIRIEIVEAAREWLKARPEVDLGRLALYGVSKGAEFALLAASRYDWIASVVAVVPSDIVWEGYGEGGAANTARSSWSFGGEALPFVPLFAFDPAHEGLYRTNTERYSRSRIHHEDRVAAARIPIEAASARVLLLASDRDEVWASGEMARNLAERLMLAKKSAQLEIKVYPRAGHQIAGTGTFPVRLYGEASSDPDAKDVVAEGDAAADLWRRTLRFLRS